MYRLKTIFDSYFESYGALKVKKKETKQSQNISTGKEVRGDSASVIHPNLTASDNALLCGTDTSQHTAVAFIELLTNNNSNCYYTT